MNDSTSQNLQKLIRNAKKELMFKVVVIGDFGVGKTSIIKRYAEGIYSTSYKITIGIDFSIKKLNWNENTHIIIQLWDVAGHERFGSLTSVYYRYAAAAIIVFDLTRPETFKSVKKWLYDLRSKIAKSVPIILLANKGDVNISNVPSCIIDFCDKNDILAWFVTSAKDDTNIDEAMFILIKTIYEDYNNKEYSVPYIQHIGGMSAKDLHTRCYKRLFTNAFYKKCSWKDFRKNFKMEDLTVTKCLYDAVNGTFPTTLKEFELLTRDYLRHAKQRKESEQNKR
ncbi:hypothetical protein RN001_002784 [Aquatica leii]|uniref:Ras-related protein Rab n=1 Tax=Aquatica leii TaxID=1421715 RepID=A0AAN7SRD2_9COLE|nr:hypothetical protein RN001_002784 [Aquatica leii]